MTNRTVSTVVILAVVALSLAGTAVAADSVKVVSATPASEMFPISPNTATIRVAYTLEWPGISFLTLSEDTGPGGAVKGS